MENFTFEDILSADYPLYFLDDVISGAVDDYTVVTVPGRDGDLHINNNRYRNRTRTLRVVFSDNSRQAFEDMMDRLLTVRRYGRLESSFYPDTFMLCRYSGGGYPQKKSIGYKMAQCDLTFDCKPQMFLKSGEEEIVITGTVVLENPTRHGAKPLLYVTGAGTLALGEDRITVNVAHDDMVIDCEREFAYGTRLGQNYNGDIELGTTNRFPVLEGATTITVPSGMTLKVVPRWWRL